MRLRVEFTTEPFDLDVPPRHALVAREVAEGAGFDSLDVGPFGNTAEGPADTVLQAVSELLRKALDAGATRISLQLNVAGPVSPAPPATPSAPAAPGGAP